MAFTGLFDLKTPDDLFKKMEHDLQRLEADRLNTYAAFDFFVTAYHMLEWVFPGRALRPKRSELEASEPLLQVCSQLANGSKHFEATNKEHTSVDAPIVKPGSFSRAFSNAFDIERLEVRLTGKVAATLGATIEVTHLARMVRDFWRRRLGI